MGAFPPPNAQQRPQPYPVQPQPQPYPVQFPPQAYPVEAQPQPYPVQSPPQALPVQSPPQALPAEPPPQAVDDVVATDGSQTSKGSSALPWIVGGAGVATIALGGVFTSLYLDAFSDTKKQYNPARESEGKTYSVLQFVCYGVGTAAVVTAILLASVESHASKGSVAVVPTISPQVAGAAVYITY
jgi:hypothetical protein